MIQGLRILGSTIVGFAVAFALVIGVEFFGMVFHPFPSDFTHTPEAMCRHVERFPPWVLAVSAAGWIATAFISTWVANRLGGRIAGIIISLFLIWAVGFNVWMLPYPLWFELASVIGITVACLLAIRKPVAAVPSA